MEFKQKYILLLIAACFYGLQITRGVRLFFLVIEFYFL